jgi:hypothetical protein
MGRKSMRKFSKRYRNKNRKTVRRKYKGGMTPKKGSIFGNRTGLFGFKVKRSTRKSSGSYGFPKSSNKSSLTPEEKKAKLSAELRHQEFLKRRAAAKADPDFVEKELAKLDIEEGQRLGKIWNDEIERQLLEKENKNKKRK